MDSDALFYKAVMETRIDLENRKSEIYKSASNESDMLTGNINRMFLCDDIEELDKHLDVSRIRIDKIYELNSERLQIEAELEKLD